MKLRRETAIIFLVTLSLFILAFLLPPIPQDPLYHRFADDRTLFGIPNMWNVISNLPFIWVGALGLRIFFSKSSPVWATGMAKWSFIILFSAIALTGLGSGFYHLNPSTETLFWDRLPMSMGFMAFLSCMISERWNPKLGEILLFPLLAVGIWSVWFWDHGEELGHGDLRPYLMVQFGGLILVGVLLSIFRPRYLNTRSIVIAMALYGLAKVFESADEFIFNWIGFISGHSLKHLAAALAGYYLVAAVKKSQSRVA